MMNKKNEWISRSANCGVDDFVMINTLGTVFR